MTALDTATFEHVAGAVAVVGAGAVSLAVRRPAWPLTIGIVLGVFSGHWADLGSPVPLDRVFLGIGMLMTVVHARTADRDALRTQPMHWLLVVVGLWALCEAVAAGTLSDSDARFSLLDRFTLIGFAGFFLAPLAYREPEDRRILVGCLVALGFYLGVDAIIETTGPRSILLPRYIDDPAVGIHFDRARGPFAEAAANGLTMIACGLAAVVAARTWRSRTARGFALLVAGLCLLGTLLTLTRAIWVGAALALLVSLVAARETRRWVLPMAAVAALGVLGAFAVIPDLQHRAQERENDDRPLWDRRNSNSAAVRMIAEKPLLGRGWGTFRRDSLAYYRQSPDFPLTVVRDVHNVYLANAVEIGLVGATLWAAALLIAVLGGALRRRGPPDLRPWRIALLGYFAAYAFAALTTPLEFTMPTLLLWVWAGMAWGPREPVSIPAPAPPRALLPAA